MLRGENCLLDFNDKKEKCGFFTTIFVEAKDTDEAELRAVEVVRKQKDFLSGLLNEQDDEPMIFLEKIVELEPASKLKKVGGRTIFSELDEEGQYEAKELELEAFWSSI